MVLCWTKTIDPRARARARAKEHGSGVEEWEDLKLMDHGVDWPNGHRQPYKGMMLVWLQR